MRALGIQHSEVYLTAGLAWLLDPDGWHGLGSKVLRRLLVQLGLPPAIDYPVRVAVEETRSGGETRGDLVVRMPGTTLLSSLGHGQGSARLLGVRGRRSAVPRG